MKLKNLKHFFITSLISSVSFLLNILPVKGEEFASDGIIIEEPGLMPPSSEPSTGEKIIGFIKGFAKIWVIPIAIGIVIVILVVRFYKKKKGEQE
jgi:hypothetical protein